MIGHVPVSVEATGNGQQRVVVRENSIRPGFSASSDAMLAIVHPLGTYVANLFKSRRRLEVENLYLRHQLNIALRRRPPSAAG